MTLPAIWKAGIYESDSQEVIVRSRKDLTKLYDAIGLINFYRMDMMETVEIELNGDGCIEVRMKEVVLT
jgi:hypothetical protein